ncbi:MAG: choice-of-anchor D domain-containing protein [Actinobacteria bacterium]|nr:choice-of-anchor D domain-containing protein [Actinomycetota bacterium]
MRGLGSCRIVPPAIAAILTLLSALTGGAGVTSQIRSQRVADEHVLVDLNGLPDAHVEAFDLYTPPAGKASLVEHAKPVPTRILPARRAPRTKSSYDIRGPQRTASTPSPSATGFAALGDDSHVIPPDTNGAVGPTQVVTALNSQIRVQDKAGTTLKTVTLNSFFGVSDAFDPRLAYDPENRRWMISAASGEDTSASRILVAVSTTTDAKGTWNVYRYLADSSGTSWADYPALGFSHDWIVVTANLVSAGDSFLGSNIWAFNKNNLYSGAGGSYSLFHDDQGLTQIPALTYDSSLRAVYLLENFAGDNGGRGVLRLSSISGPVGDETYAPGYANPSTTSTWWDTLPGSSEIAPQSGSSAKISVGDGRMQSVVYRNGSLFAAQTIFLPASSSPARSSVQWWQIGTHGDVQQLGRIDDSSGTYFYAYPSIAVSSSNDVLVGYSRFSAGTYPSAAYSFRSSSDPFNTMRSLALLKSGAGPYNKTFSGSENRWGDYSAAAVDPSDDKTLWTIQEYAAGSNLWGTWWGKVVPPATSGTPALTFSPSSLSFGSLLVGGPGTAPVSVFVRNTGSAALGVTSVHITGTNSSDFTLMQDECTQVVLFPAQSCTVSARFQPLAAGARSAAITLTDTAPNAPHSAPLTGTGLVDTTPPVTHFTTGDGSVVLGFPGVIAGRSTDDLTGVANVYVAFSGSNGSQSTGATLSCNAAKTDCSWTAPLPLMPGYWTAHAYARDYKGNVEPTNATVTVLVV